MNVENFSNPGTYMMTLTGKLDDFYPTVDSLSVSFNVIVYQSDEIKWIPPPFVIIEEDEEVSKEEIIEDVVNEEQESEKSIVKSIE